MVKTEYILFGSRCRLVLDVHIFLLNALVIIRDSLRGKIVALKAMQKVNNTARFLERKAK